MTNERDDSMLTAHAMGELAGQVDSVDSFKPVINQPCCHLLW